MKTRFVIAALGVVLVSGGLLAFRFLRGPARESGEPTRTAGASIPSATGQATPTAAQRPSVNTERDPALVFQRAFWRRPAAGDRVLQGERSEWTDGTGAVQRWRWFVAVQASPGLRDWLLKDNPFELVRTDSGTAGPELSAPPAWFPAPSALRGFACYRHREGRFLVFHDVQTNRIFATDSGAGFAVASR